MNTGAFNKAKTIIPSFLAVMCVALLVIPTYAAAGQRSRATDISGFDSMSITGCANSNETYVTSPACIRLDLGWGQFSFGDFREARIDLYARSYGTGRPLYITLADADDTENYVEIRIEALFSQGGQVVEDTCVIVTDRYGGEKRSDTKTVTGKDAKCYKTWAKVAIDVTSPDGLSTKGSGKVLSVSVGNVTIINEFEMMSSELSTDTETRKFNYVIFRSKYTGDIWRLDEVDINAGGNLLLNTPYTLVIVGTTVVAAVVYKFKLYPKKNPLGRWL